ncbi:hypothetical protein SNE40_012833 [Patella caerulea]|uniref:NIPSNAP domain-containing protein n=1 Tax=Patella caerulea TaxID=87958 RepID=A0AAN8JLS6_PATCE
MALQRISRICRVSSKNVSVISRNLTTSEQKPIYELRCYNVYPKDFKRFLDLTTEWIAVRTKYSKMMGYWTSEIGGLNDVLHIWEYDSLSHRASVRKALSGDEEWAKNYFSLILPMLIRQDNSLTC